MLKSQTVAASRSRAEPRGTTGWLDHDTLRAHQLRYDHHSLYRHYSASL